MEHEQTRRDFLRNSSCLLGAAALNPRVSSGAASPLRVGLVTDTHYADVDPAGPRTYRESSAKLAECVRFMNDQRVDLLVELGDFKDQGKPPDETTTLGYLRTIEGVFRGFNGPRAHVLGNHDVDSISKEQFLEITREGYPFRPTSPASRAAAYSWFDLNQKGVRFIVLDACFRADGTDYDRGNFEWADANVPASELALLDRALGKAPGPVIVFAHQQLDGEGAYYVKNATAVRALLEQSKKVLAVFQGHRHEGGYSQINGIHYYTLKAVIEGSGAENSAYAIVEADDRFNLTVTGYRRADSRVLRRA